MGTLIPSLPPPPLTTTTTVTSMHCGPLTVCKDIDQLTRILQLVGSPDDRLFDKISSDDVCPLLVSVLLVGAICARENNARAEHRVVHLHLAVPGWMQAALS